VSDKLVERLRKSDEENTDEMWLAMDRREAASRIEALERALGEAREALEQIAGNAWRPLRRDPDSFCHPEGCHSPGIARTALAKLSAAPERQ
jgi:hypothetical protein